MEQIISQQNLKDHIQVITTKIYNKNKYKKWLRRVTRKQIIKKDHKILGSSGGRGL